MWFLLLLNQHPTKAVKQSQPFPKPISNVYAFHPKREALERLFQSLTQTYPNIKELKSIAARPTHQKIDHLKRLANRNGIVIVEGSTYTKVARDTIYLKGDLSGGDEYLAHLAHEIAHILTNSEGEAIPTFLEMYVLGKAVDRETDLQIVFPIVLPFLEKLEDSKYTGGSYGFYTLRQLDNAADLMYLILTTIGPSNIYRCNGSSGEACVKQIANTLGRAYQVSRELAEGEEVLQIFDSIAVELLNPLYPKARP